MDNHTTYKKHIDDYYRQKEFDDFVDAQFKYILSKLKGGKLMGITLPEELECIFNKSAMALLVSAYYAGMYDRNLWK
jgi:hypothetical protein